MTKQSENTHTAPEGLLLDAGRLGLVTDLYELTMAAAYWSAGLADRQATFELFFRSLPPGRSYMVAAGLEQALYYLLTARFTDEDIAYVRGLPVFAHAPAAWFGSLCDWHFTGDVWAIPEGTVVFPNEPLMRVTASLDEAQIVETYLIAALAYPTSVATKAARVATAARGRSVVDFGTRRGHGPQAGMWAARAAFIGGCQGTSNVAAAERLGIPPVGTLAHSFIMAVEDEREAFEKFSTVFPDRPTFLIDTFETVEGARNALRATRRPGQVRLDSGDLVPLSREVRRILDDGGAPEVKIFASGDLNEYKIAALMAAGAPIDAFGVGTELTTVADAPSLGCVYKLVELSDGRGSQSGRIKLSAGKRTYPGRKQVFRQRDPDGRFDHDVIGLDDERLPGERLLVEVMRAGQLLGPLPSLSTLQSRCREQLDCLPPALLALDGRTTYPVEISAALDAEFDRLARVKESIERTK
jgi:nicotinate phosphoribosyltransferase